MRRAHRRIALLTGASQIATSSTPVKDWPPLPVHRKPRETFRGSDLFETWFDVPPEALALTLEDLKRAKKALEKAERRSRAYCAALSKLTPAERDELFRRPLSLPTFIGDVFDKLPTPWSFAPRSPFA